jgi:hypothetical protein
LPPLRRDSPPGTWGGGTLLYRVSDPERFGVAELDAEGRVVGFEEKPRQPKSDLIPIGVYFLRPERVRRDRGAHPSGRGEFEITDVLNHYIPNGGLFTEVYEGDWVDAGTVASLMRAAELARDEDDQGRLPAPQRVRSADAMGERARAPTSRHRWRRVHRLLLSCATILARDDGTRITVLDKLTYAGNEANLAAGHGGGPRDGALASASCSGDIADPAVVGRSSPTWTPS